MRLIDKLLFLLLALCFTALGILMIYSVLNAQVVLSVLEDFLFREQWIVVITGAIVAFIGIFLILNMLFTRKEKIARILGNELGQVTMSLEAIESMIHRTVSHIDGIKEVTPKLKIVGDKVAICLHITVQSDMIVPELGSAIQKSVKEDLESMAGISIAEIKVFVSAVDGQSAAQNKKGIHMPTIKKSEGKKADAKEDNKAQAESPISPISSVKESSPAVESQPDVQAEEEKVAVSE